MRKTPTAELSDLNKRTKKEWIESAGTVFKVERFEMAGALFNCKDSDLLSQQEVKGKLDKYLGLVPAKEEANVDSTD
ncbi:hypothetical protein JQN58_04850 [Aneurinibacillus sp. BA2021]|nr:hypothetical protein [Aneurinibacillus sp. BA2021]